MNASQFLHVHPADAVGHAATIVGGLLVSQVLTLFTTPVIYLYLDRLRRRIGSEATTA